MNNAEPATPQSVFFPFAHGAFEKMRSSNGRFVYYTSADTAYRILSNQELWMRSTRTMNDSREVDHGIECVTKAATGTAEGARFRTAINSLFPGLFEEVFAFYMAWTPGIQADTFIACVSEHDSTEDQFGRLSMWRAYGGSCGVALVLNGGVMQRDSNVLAAYSSPVAYMDVAGVANQLSVVAERVTAQGQSLLALGREAVHSYLFNVLRFGSVCTKHPAFKEEREWRVIASPAMEQSPHVGAAVEVVGGVPQLVLKLKLEDHPDKGLFGLSLPTLLDRVLVGPSQYPHVVWRALVRLLDSAKVPEPEKKVFITNIPLRERQR